MSGKYYYFKNKCLFVEKDRDNTICLVPHFGKNLTCILISQITNIEVKSRNIFYKAYLIFCIFLIVGGLLKIFSVFDEFPDIAHLLGQLLFISFSSILIGGVILPIFFREFSKRTGILLTILLLKHQGKNGLF